MDLTALNGVGVSGIFVLMLVKMFLDWNSKQQQKKHGSEITVERRISSALSSQRNDDLMNDLSRLLNDNSRVMEQILDQMRAQGEVMHKLVVQVSNLLEHQRMASGGHLVEKVG